MRSSRRRIAALAVSLLLCVQAAAMRADGPDPSDPVDDPSNHATALENYDPLYDEIDDIAAGEHISDPLEPMNRTFFRVNEGLDWLIFNPLTKVYRFLVPTPARRSVERAFHNLNSPVIFANLVMQGRGRDAARTAGRFAANTTLGVVGLFDYADEVIGWERTDADFGQTLAVYGMPSGPYLVVPLFGPSNFRDGFGDVVDQVMDPLTYFVAPLSLQWSLLFGGSQGLAYREANADALDALRDASIDFYAAMRSAYTQARDGDIKAAREARDAP